MNIHASYEICKNCQYMFPDMDKEGKPNIGKDGKQRLFCRKDDKHQRGGVLETTIGFVTKKEEKEEFSPKNTWYVPDMCPYYLQQACLSDLKEEEKKTKKGVSANGDKTTGI